MKNRQTYNDVTSRKRFVSLTCYWNFHKLQNNQQTFLKMFCVWYPTTYPIICIHSILLLLFFSSTYFAIRDRYHYSQIREMQNFSMIPTLRWLHVITQHFKQTLLNIIDLALIYICSDVLHWVRWSMYMICKSNIIYVNIMWCILRFDIYVNTKYFSYGLSVHLRVFTLLVKSYSPQTVHKHWGILQIMLICKI